MCVPPPIAAQRPKDIKEALLHVAVYAGVPAANGAFKIAKEELARREGGGQ